MTGVTVRRADWRHDRTALAEVRRRVFIDEQGVPEALEWDEHDAYSLHFLAQDGALAVGCARLLPDGHAGRMAVLPAYRGRGIGRDLLDAVVVAARQQGFSALWLSAQTQAAGFYARVGFIVTGAPYDEAGIAHVAMQRTLTD